MYIIIINGYKIKRILIETQIYQLYEMLSLVKFTAKQDKTGGIELNLLCDKFNDDSSELLDLMFEVSSTLAICSIISTV